MQRFDIYNASFSWRGCEDMRPWLIVDVRPNNVYGCFPFASECYEGSCFALDAPHPDFAATGLTKSCYIIDTRIYDIALAAFGRRRGALTGTLLRDFIEFSGI